MTQDPDLIIPDKIDDVMYADGLDDALLGHCARFGSPLLAIYSTKHVIATLINRDGMSFTDAREFFEFNILGAWMGDNTPVFMRDDMEWADE